MATGSGLVFHGSSDGVLSVHDGRDGRVLRRIEIGTGIMAAPMAYEIDGTEYVAVAAGFGGAFADAGMAAFDDVLSERDARDLHAYLAAPLPAAAPPRRRVDLH